MTTRQKWSVTRKGESNRFCWNNYAIDTAGIGDSLQRSAAAFNAAHTDIDKSIALITAANEVLQDPKKVGRHYADLCRDAQIIKVAISVKPQRWARPRKDFISL